MKRFLFSVLAVLMVSAGWSKCLRLTLADGSQVYYQLGGERNPMLRLTDNGLTINTDAYTFENITSFKILNEDAPNGLERVACDLQSNVPVKVYNLEGKEMKVANQDASALPAGVYILNSANASIKIVKR